MNIDMIRKIISGIQINESDSAHGCISTKEIDRVTDMVLSEINITTSKLEELIRIIKLIRQHGGPISYRDGEDSIGYYVCCGHMSYEEHNDDCWYRMVCQFLDKIKENK